MMPDKQILQIPGPVPVPPSVNRAMSRPIIGHRDAEMKELMKTVQAGLQQVFGTHQDVLILTASGTAALETAAVNLCSPGDEVLVVITGAFGDRFADICDAFGYQVHRMQVPWGESAKPEQLESWLKRQPGIKAVFMTYCETSTGVLNPIQELSQVIHAHSDALIAVDGVSCIGGVEANMDKWGVDVYVTGSQKAMMLPPGLAFVAASQRAWQAIEQSQTNRFYLDLDKYRNKLEENTTPFTPAISLLFGLEQVLDLMKTEGFENIYKRHRLMRDMTRAAFKALGIPLLASDQDASPTVTAVKPDQIQADQLRKMLRDEFQLIVAGGQQQLKGEICRIGHLGYCTPLDVLTYLSAIELALCKSNIAVEPGTGLKAAQEVYLNHA